MKKISQKEIQSIKYPLDKFNIKIELRITVPEQTKTYTQLKYNYLMDFTDGLCRDLKNRKRKFAMGSCNEGFDKIKGQYFFRTLRLIGKPSNKIIWL